MVKTSALAIAAVLWCGALVGVAERGRPPAVSFRTGDTCLACHNGLTTATGEDVSIGSDWRGSMMANSARDPYWQASVRRETLDHPAAAAKIEDSCATCHMPMARADAAANAQPGKVFGHLPIKKNAKTRDRLAHDGVSCTICHQITADKLGTPASFNGGFVINPPTASHGTLLGPFAIDAGPASVMQSATSFRPTEAAHVRQSELCATCHTLYTEALGPNGETIGRLPEQMPFLEWQHSAFKDEKSCQACHMPAAPDGTRISSVLGTPRDGLARHSFRGGNAFILAMLNRYRRELDVVAEPQELETAASRSAALLQSETATVSVERAERSGDRLAVDVLVQNATGHKLPTGFPSRRAWLHVAIRDRAGRVVFDSGALGTDGRIAGNDNDADPLRYEPHFTEITRPDDVQIYESIIGDAAGAVTTGLLSGTRYLKDNRLLPRGFDKATAGGDIAVIGEARGDGDFAGGGDRVRYAVHVAGAEGPHQIEVHLRFQTVSFRWARNLDRYQAMETKRFVGYYDAMAEGSGIVLARATATVR
jgi:hypothetical protein